MDARRCDDERNSARKLFASFSELLLKEVRV
ncbi:Hypothetical protein BIBO1_1316 [Brucella inopinata BO1]|nr:Hypothetical protein BIBO1_1316 [Brucella inopinata BO1]